MAITRLHSINGRVYGYVTAVIAKDGTTSAEADLEGMTVMGLLIPTIDSANLTFTVCNTTGGTFQTLKAMDGTAHTITATTGNFALACDDLSDLAAYRYVKIVASAAQTTAARTFTWVLKA